MSAAGISANRLGRGSGSLGLKFALLAAICLALMVVDHRTERLSVVREGLSLVVYPVQALVDLPFRAWQKFDVAITDQRKLLSENEDLQRRLLLAKVRLQRFEAVEAENRRLRDLLDSTAKLSDQVLVAEILSVDLDPYRQRFAINRGTLDGTFVGQPVLDADGVVGQLISVGPLTSEALLITDADHAVPVTIERNGLRTIAVGTGDSGRLRLPYLTNSADIKVGDVLLSSGLGGVFPPGYPVGRVSQVNARPGQGFADVVAEPAAALDRDREVLLVFSPGEGDNAKRRSAAEQAGGLAPAASGKSAPTGDEVTSPAVTKAAVNPAADAKTAQAAAGKRAEGQP